MNIARLLKPENVRYEATAGSKKYALDLLSQTLAQDSQEQSAGAVLEELVGRERLGSTGLGDSVAMPHARLDGIEESIGAFLRLGEPVDFGSADGKPVDLLFGVIMPLACTDDHIREFRELIAHLRDPKLQERLRQTDEPAELYALLTDSLTAVYRGLSV
jgi:PTS system nitrogen regulatory IIA component